MKTADAIIIGAGAAGLAAAKVLSEGGLAVAILEARDRVGGRVFSIREPSLPVPIEMGAEFIHGRAEPLWEMVHRAGLCVYEVPFDHFQRRGKRLVRVGDFAGELDKIMDGLSRLGRRDVSFADYLRDHRTGPGLADARRLARAFVEGFDAADPDRISARSLAAEHEGLGDVGGQTQFRLLDGYGALIDHLRAGLDPRRITIRLGAPVVEVRWRRGRVEVGVGPRATIVRARAAIITLPVGILQLPPDAPGAVRFVPEVPRVRRAAAQLGSGPVVKVILTFREPFWETGGEDGLRAGSFLHDPRAAFPTWWTARPLHLPMLTGWAGGPRARALSGRSRQALADEALGSLASLLGWRRGRIRSFVTNLYIHDWPADPHALGAYSYVTVGGAGARAHLAEPVEGTLFFAGEAADTSGQASTVAGALASGRRAAEALLSRRALKGT